MPRHNDDFMGGVKMGEDSIFGCWILPVMGACSTSVVIVDGQIVETKSEPQKYYKPVSCCDEFKVAYEDWWQMNGDDTRVSVYLTKEYDYEGEYTLRDISYCPFCGKKIEIEECGSS